MTAQEPDRAGESALMRPAPHTTGIP